MPTLELGKMDNVLIPFITGKVLNLMHGLNSQTFMRLNPFYNREGFERKLGRQHRYYKVLIPFITGKVLNSWLLSLV